MQKILDFAVSLDTRLTAFSSPWESGIWTLLFLSLTFAVAVGVWLGIRVHRGPKFIHQRVAMPLALVERAVRDALRELYRAEGAVPYSLEENEPLGWAPFDAPLFSATLQPFEASRQNTPPFSRLFINAFERDALQLASISAAEIASMGKSAAREYETLVRSIHSWNRLSGEEESANALLPTILIADQAARNLSRLVEKKAWEQAQKNASQRILMGLIAPAEEHFSSPLGEQ